MDWSVSHRPTFWQGTKLAYPEVPKEHPKFSQSVTVGNLVLVSGCGGKDTVTGAPAPPDVAGQVNTALDKTRAALEEAGSSMENIIKTFFLIRSLDDYGEVRKTETEYYERHAPSLIETPPSATLMVVPGLANPDYRLEYEVIAAKDRSAPDWGVTYYPEFWGGRELAFPHVPKEHAKFARTQVIGGLVAVSGCQALDHGTVRVETMDFAEQTRICLDKVRIGMEETGGSLETTAKTVVFIKDPARISEYREIERAYFAEHAPALVDNPPASTLMVVEELPRPEFLVEVEAFGVAGDTPPGWPVAFYPGAVRAGRLLFSAAIGAGGGIEAQIEAAFTALKASLENAGGSLDGLVKTTMMLTRLEDYPVMRRVETEFYEAHAPALLENPPASTFIRLQACEGKDSQFQVDGTAVL